MDPGNSTSGSDEDPGEGLLRALVSTFSLIAFGYFAARFKWLPPPDLGMAQFIGRVALPSLVFVAIAQLDVSTVNWDLVFGIAIGKTIVFGVVAGVTCATNWSDPGGLARAGIYGIFVTQSNDFALGLPLLASMYPPEITRYLYVAAPISFLWLNLIGFAMMEYSNRQKERQLAIENPPAVVDVGSGPQPKKRSLALVVFIGVVTNPIIFMTMFGVIFNAMFNNNLPEIIAKPFSILADAFSAGALLVLGMSMSGKLFYLRGPRLIKALMLIAAKTIMLPVITKATINIISPDDDEISNFAFVYSTFPTAPGVLAFSLQYGVEPVAVASMVVLCTLLSAPIMYVSAKLATLSDNEADVKGTTSQMAVALGTISAVACAVTAVLLLLNRRYKYPLDRAVFGISAGSFLYAVAQASCSATSLGPTGQTIRHGVAYFGWVATLLSIVTYAITLDALSAAPNARLDPLITRTAPILTWLLATGMACVSVGLTSGSSIEAGQDYECFVDEGRVEFDFIAAKFVLPAITLAAVIAVACKSQPDGGLPENRGGDKGCNNAAADADDDDRLLTLRRTPDDPTAGEQRPLLPGTADEPGFDAIDPLEPVNRLQPHEFKHRIFVFTEIFCLLLTMTHAALSFTTTGSVGPKYEVGFLDTFTTSARGVILFLCFGTDEVLWSTLGRLFAPAIQSLRKFVFKTEVADLERCRDWLMLSTDAVESREECSKCIKLLIRDRKELEKTLSYGLRKYKLIFTGSSMVDWILEQDFAFDRESAEELGRRLLLHGCFTHVTNEHHFYDEGYFYRFNNLDFLEERFRAIESDIARGQEHALTSSSAAADLLRASSTSASIRHRTNTLNTDGLGSFRASALRASPVRPVSNAVV